MRLSMKEFEELVEEAIDSIPKAFEPYLENTVFIVEESSPEGVMGLYHGAGEERDAVAAQPVREGAPLGVDGRGAAGEAIGDELLRPREHAHVERPGLEDRGPRHRLPLQTDHD